VACPLLQPIAFITYPYVVPAFPLLLQAVASYYIIYKRLRPYSPLLHHVAHCIHSYAVACPHLQQCAAIQLVVYDSARGSVRLCDRVAVCGSVCEAVRQCAAMQLCAAVRVAVCGSV
jgi:hypothetical protein